MKKPLKEGNTECSHCEGTGQVEIPDSLKGLLKEFSFKKDQIICYNCLGKGQLDWIEMITGKKRPIIIKPLKNRNPIENDLLEKLYKNEYELNYYNKVLTNVKYGSIIKNKD